MMLIAVTSLADDSSDDNKFFENFITGHYLLIGKSPDSSRTYQGRVQIYTDKGGLTRMFHENAEFWGNLSEPVFTIVRRSIAIALVQGGS